MAKIDLAAARMQVLDRCSEQYDQRPPNDWALWEAGADRATFDALNEAAHSLEEEALIECRFLQREAFAARLTWRGVEYIKARKARPPAPPDTKVAFLDTNVFLHSIPLEQIIWPTVLRAKNVVLVVSRGVAHELEQKKYDPERWLQKRAAKAGAWIQNIVEHNNHVRDAVRLHIEHRELSGGDLKHHGLSFDSGDDRLLGCALAYAGGNKDNLMIVSWDNIFLSRAATYGFDTHRLAEEYKLPSAPDPMEVENKKLRAIIADYKDTLPKLDLTFADGSKELTVKLVSRTQGDIALNYMREWSAAQRQVEVALWERKVAQNDQSGHTANDTAEFWNFTQAQGAAEETANRCHPVGFLLQNTGHHWASGVRVIVQAPRDVDISPKIVFPDEPHLRDPDPPVQGVNLRRYMPLLRDRPIRLSEPDPSGTPGIGGPFGLEGKPDQFRYDIQGQVKDRTSETLPEVMLLFGSDLSGRVALRYEVQAAGVPSGSFTGELVINVERAVVITPLPGA